MKTLIINGSPKKNGDTAALIDELLRHLEGEVRIISGDDSISPCIDCRFCWKKNGHWSFRPPFPWMKPTLTKEA